MRNREGLLPSATGGVSVRSAMSYGDPSMADALTSLREDGAERVLCLPLYPQTAFCITGSVADSFERTLAELGWDPPRRVVVGYAQNAFYLEAVASSIEGRGFGRRPDDRLMLSFHSVPLKDERAGDTYRQQARQTADAVAERLGADPASVTVSYQSVFGPDPSAWARPLSLDVLRGWCDQEFRVFFCCPGFAVECLETLYDVPQELLSALEGDEVEPPSPARCLKGGAIGPRGRFVWIPCLDDSDAHAVVVRSVIDDPLRDGWRNSSA
jgi:ferrochelatase